MATAGMDGQMRIWDIRKFTKVHEYFTPKTVSSLDISQRDLLAVGYGTTVTIWKDAFQTKQVSPYMNHQAPRDIVQDIRFCPYDDVLGYGHINGISSIIVPGSGEPNFDSYAANPYQTVKQRREAEVHALLEKASRDDYGQSKPATPTLTRMMIDSTRAYYVGTQFYWTSYRDATKHGGAATFWGIGKSLL
jgi:hypothetical protein